ncbi:MAG: hypothetical protein CMP11_04305 [Zetaproteobacteria bacterium]|nr:hypothetical protein [Pseudobdellovibrionaceae bacterium]
MIKLVKVTYKIFFLFLIFMFMTQCVTVKEDKYLSLGNQFARDGLYREALDSYTRAYKKNPNSSVVLKNLGSVLIHLGSYKKGVTLLQKALPPYQKSFEIHFLLAEGHRALSNYSKAIYYYQKSLELNKKSRNSLRGLAWSYYNISYYSQALKTAKKLRSLYSNDFDGVIILSRILLKLERYKSVYKLTQKTLRSKLKQNLKGRNYLHSIQAEALYALGQFSKAKELFKKSLRYDPLLVSALVGLSKCLIKENKSEKAIEYLEKALRLKPDMKEIYLLLAKNYEKKNIKKSLYYYRSFYRMIDTDPEYLSSLRRIRSKIFNLKKGA